MCYLSPMINVPCSQCGTALSRWPYEIARKVDFFCNSSCQAAFKRRSVSFLCDNCGAPGRIPPWRVGHSTLHFCNRDCYAAHKRVGSISSYGYRVFCINGRDVFEHRLVMENHIGRRLGSKEIVHHVDGNKLNNDISNLRVMDRGDHIRHHKPLTWDIEAAKTMIAEGASLRKAGKVLG